MPRRVGVGILTLAIAGSVVVSGWPGESAVAKRRKRGNGGSVTTVGDELVGSPANAVTAAVTASALPVARILGASLGKPSCPPIEKPKVGLTLQCVVAFSKVPIGWLVTLGEGDTLRSQPTFPVVSKRSAELLAGAGATCDLPAFAGRPFGAVVNCRVGRSTVELQVGPDGTLVRK